MSSFIKFFRKEPVLVISAAAAAVSVFFVPPSADYISYIDFKVLSLLFCLMAMVAGFGRCRVFDILGQRLLLKSGSMRTISLVLVMLPFFTSMLITNDVALITFVPFTILILSKAGKQQHIIRIVVLQTVAANLGSMATPVGNPQSLYIYNRFGMTAQEFFSAMLPLTGISLLIIVLLVIFRKNETLTVSFDTAYSLEHKKHLFMYTGLFAVCLLCVFRIIDYRIMLAAVIACMLLFDRKLFLKPDYFLLITFVCFFIFSGNLGNIPEIRTALTELVNTNCILTSAAASQAISNVPAAVLLSEFTDNAGGLLIGTNLGGLGTIIASLASLISLKCYLRTGHAETGRYMAVFTAVNFGLLAVLLAFVFLTGM